MITNRKRGDNMSRKSLVSGSFSLSYSYSQKGPSNLNVRHCHDQHEILYVIEGGGRYIVEGTEYPILRGSLLLVPRLSYHCVELDPGIPYERYVLNFSDGDISRDAGGVLSRIFNSGENGCFYSADSLSPAIMSIFDRFENADIFDEHDREIYTKCLLTELILHLSVSQKESVAHDDEELGVRVIKYLNEHIDKDVSLDKLSKRFFVSKYYLCRAFKKHNGISVHGYINQKRVMYAKQLIESGETASGAAYKVGFGDYSAFYRAYVKIVGTSPTNNESVRSKR